MSLNSCFDISICNETLTIYICTQTCVLCQQAAALREGLTVTRCHRRNVTSHHFDHSVLRPWQFSFPWQFSQPLALSSNDRHIVQHHLQDHLNLHLLHILIENLVTQTTSTITNVSTFLFSCCNPLYVADFCNWCSYGHSSYKSMGGRGGWEDLILTKL